MYEILPTEPLHEISNMVQACLMDNHATSPIFIRSQTICGRIMLWRCRRRRRLLSVDTKVSATYLMMG